MPESNKPFVVTDRRKFTSDGELRPEAAHAAEEREHAAPPPPPTPAAPAPPPSVLFQTTDQALPPEPADADLDPNGSDLDDSLPVPTPEQMAEIRFAYQATADRLETAIRAANPAADHPPAMDFSQLVQSFYLTAIMQLGGATPEGQKPQVDILGARQSIDMLAVLADRTQGNLNPNETRLLDSALFELRVAFLDVTDALTRAAAARGPAPAQKPGLVL